MLLTDNHGETYVHINQVTPAWHQPNDIEHNVTNDVNPLDSFNATNRTLQIDEMNNLGIADDSNPPIDTEDIVVDTTGDIWSPVNNDAEVDEVTANSNNDGHVGNVEDI